MDVAFFTYGEEFDPQLGYHHFQWNFIFEEYSFQEMKTETQGEGEEWGPEKYLNGRIICKLYAFSGGPSTCTESHSA